MSAAHRLRLALRRLGVDVIPYPRDTSGGRRLKLLRHYGVTLVLDVGANEGQFASELRSLGFDQRIISFEPLSAAFSALSARAAKDRRWAAVRTAVGSTNGTATLNVAANSVSSSLLPMLPQHLTAAPSSRYVDREDVPIARLDELARSSVGEDDRLFIKVDAQGFSSSVLDGAKGLLPKTVGLQLELSLVPLYEGEWTFEDGVAQVRSHGYSLMGLETGFTDFRSGRTLQVDAIFFRERPQERHGAL